MAKIYKYKCKIEMPTSDTGESIEAKMRRVTENNEPIDAGAPEIFTDRKDGVIAAYDIRTDRFTLALDAMDKVSKSRTAQREELIKQAEKPEDDNKTA